MGTVRFRGRDWVKSIFLDSNVDPGSTKDVDPGTCPTWQNHGDRPKHLYAGVIPSGTTNIYRYDLYTCM